MPGNFWLRQVVTDYVRLGEFISRYVWLNCLDLVRPIYIRFVQVR
jgi:hypothetical protein